MPLTFQQVLLPCPSQDNSLTHKTKVFMRSRKRNCHKNGSGCYVSSTQSTLYTVIFVFNMKKTGKTKSAWSQDASILLLKHLCRHIVWYWFFKDVRGNAMDRMCVSLSLKLVLKP